MQAPTKGTKGQKETSKNTQKAKAPPKSTKTGSFKEVKVAKAKLATSKVREAPEVPVKNHTGGEPATSASAKKKPKSDTVKAPFAKASSKLAVKASVKSAPSKQTPSSDVPTRLTPQSSPAMEKRAQDPVSLKNLPTSAPSKGPKKMKIPPKVGSSPESMLKERGPVKAKGKIEISSKKMVSGLKSVMPRESFGVTSTMKVKVGFMSKSATVKAGPPSMAMKASKKEIKPVNKKMLSLAKRSLSMASDPLMPKAVEGLGNQPRATASRGKLLSKASASGLLGGSEVTGNVVGFSQKDGKAGVGSTASGPSLGQLREGMGEVAQNSQQTLLPGRLSVGSFPRHEIDPSGDPAEKASTKDVGGGASEAEGGAMRMGRPSEGAPARLIMQKPVKLVVVSPETLSKIRSFDRKMRSTAEEILTPGRIDSPFFDFRIGGCHCWGLSACVHSPFFCPADHSHRALPQGRMTWHGGVFYPTRKLGWQGYGMGGAGDNAGGYLGGAYTNVPYVSATMEAISSVQRNDANLASLLPGGLSAVGGLSVIAHRKPKWATARGLADGAFRLADIIDTRTGQLLHPDRYPTGSDGLPIIPDAYRREIMNSARLIGGGRPGLMSRAPPPAAINASRTARLTGRAGIAGGAGGVARVGRSQALALRGRTQRMNAFADVLANRSKRFNLPQAQNMGMGDASGFAMPSGGDAGRSLTDWLNQINLMQIGNDAGGGGDLFGAGSTMGGGPMDMLSSIMGGDPELMRLMGGGAGMISEGHMWDAPPAGVGAGGGAGAGAGLDPMQSLFSQAMRPDVATGGTGAGGAGQGQGGGVGASTFGGGTAQLLGALDAALAGIMGGGGGGGLTTGMDMAAMDMSDLASFIGHVDGAPTLASAGPGEAASGGGTSQQRRMARKIKKLKELRKLVQEGQLTVEDILAAHEKAARLSDSPGDRLVEVKPGTELIPPSERGGAGETGGDGTGSGGGGGGGGGGGSGPGAVPGTAAAEAAPPPAPKPDVKKPPPPGGKKGAPPPPPGAGGAKKKAPPPKKKGAAAIGGGKGKRLRKMPWEALDTTQDTQFDEVAKMPVEVDKEQVETDFSLAKKTEGEGDAADGAPKKKKQEVIKVLPDQKRAYTMSIATARITKMGFTALKDAINNLDPAVLTPDACATLIEYAPRPDEIAAVEAFVDSGGDITKCDSPDQFVYALKDVKNLKQKLEAHAFALNFAAELDELSLPVEKLKAACECLRNSKRLPRFLFLVIRIGNVVNETNVKGIKLTSIPRLTEYKTSTKPVRNLLQYIVGVIMHGPDKAPNEETAAAMSHVTVEEAVQSLDMIEELKPLIDGSKIDLEGIEQRIQKFAGQLKKTSTEVQKLGETDPIVDANLSPFVTGATKQMTELQKLLADTREEFASAASYYGEDPESIKKLATHTYLGLPAKLARELQTIVKDIRDKQAREAKRLAAKGGKAVAKKAPAKAKAPEVVVGMRAEEAGDDAAPAAKVMKGAMEA